MASPFDEIANAIIAAQKKMMGDAPATDTAKKASGVAIDGAGKVSVIGDGPSSIDALVKSYAGVSGPLAERMCYMAAQGILQANPGVAIPSFSRF